jgi:hypothetical protein
MSLFTRIIDSWGTKVGARVSKEGQLNVVAHPHPPQGEQISAAPVREFFTTAAGSSDMKVNGATTNVEFLIEADPVRDKYIKIISWVIADASAVLNKFGNITALTNGCVLEWKTNDEGTLVISDQLTSNFEFIRLCAGTPSFGDGAGAFRAGNVFSTSEGYIPVLDIAKVFGLPFGFRLRAGSSDVLKFTIRDDVSGVDQFDAIVYGIKI